MTRILLRRGTAAEWVSVNPVLLEGEPGVETDTDKVKIGDGHTAWNSLGYAATGDVASAVYAEDDHERVTFSLSAGDRRPGWEVIATSDDSTQGGDVYAIAHAEPDGSSFEAALSIESWNSSGRIRMEVQPGIVSMSARAEPAQNFPLLQFQDADGMDLFVLGPVGPAAVRSVFGTEVNQSSLTYASFYVRAGLTNSGFVQINASNDPDTGTVLFVTPTPGQTEPVVSFPGFSVGPDGAVVLNGALTLGGLPTVDPGVVNAVWNDGGSLKLSAGPP